MRKRIPKLHWFPFIIIGLVLIPLGLSLVTPQPVTAQCGSSASSCKNCHEVNASYPVNASGDWHVSHAFGDFCAFCHAGNVQATDKDAAHVGMIYPLADPKGSCASCHAQDYEAKAQLYATTLGTTIGVSNTGPNAANVTSTSTGTNPDDVECKPIAAPGENRATGALIDFNRRYDIEVLGVTDTSRIGNLILWIIGGGLLVIGAALAWRFEKLGEVWRKARAVPSDDWRQLAYSGAYDVHGPVIPRATPSNAEAKDLPAVNKTDLEIDLTRLDDLTQAALKTLLADPVHGTAILQAIARLDPMLVHGLQNLDKKDRDLLLAVVEQLGKDD
jgi:hypothetical protein